MNAKFNSEVLLRLQIQRPLWTLPISQSLLRKLKDAGFEYCEDILNETSSQEAKQILSDAKIDFSQYVSVPATQTALEMYKEEINAEDNIVTFSRAIDDLFEGGIPTGKITELVGAPGCGKTQICLQLVVSIQMPSFLGGLNGSVVYIETNCNFSSKRIKEIHSSCSAHCANVSKELPCSSNDDQHSQLQDFIERNPLSRITKYSVESMEELRSSILMTKLMLENQTNNIKLIVVDSFTFPFYTTDTNLERTKLITDMLILLCQIASSHHVAVVVTNELTTCVLDNGMTEITPSLGESFAHIIHNRLMLGKHKRTSRYTALLYKSTEFPSDSAYFQITQGGIRDVPVE